MIEKILIRRSGEPIVFFPELGCFADEPAFEGFKAGLYTEELLDRIRSQPHCSARSLKEPGSAVIQHFHADHSHHPEWHGCIEYILRHPEYERLQRPAEAWLYSTGNGKPQAIQLR